MSKRSMWLQMNSNSSPVLSNDVLIDIFLRLDPSSIFNCILVCKDWLRVIVEPDFRQDYLKIWMDHPKLLVGFLTYRYQFLWIGETEFCDRSDRTIVTFLAASKLGGILKASEPMQRPGYIVSKSCSNDGFLLFGTIPNTFYVCKPFTNATHKLPSPPVIYEKVALAIITQDSNHFKVIVARTKSANSDNILDIQTFSSSTWMWEPSKIHCYPDLRLTGEPGLVSSKGVVYWSDYSNLAAYDTNNQRISLIPQPWHMVEHTCSYSVEDGLYCYGVSPQGSIYCATHVLCKHWVTGMGTIQVWVLDETIELDETDDEDDDDRKHWKFMYKVNLESMWVKHSSILEPMFGGKPSVPFTFVSFVHGRTSCIYVELERVLFLYNLDTQELDRISHGAYYDSEDAPHGFCIPRNKKLPLTLPELGIWPVSSPVLHLR